MRKELAQGRLDPQNYEQVRSPIVSWIFKDDPIATPASGKALLKVYPKAPHQIHVRKASDFGANRIGHDGAFRNGMEPLWREILDWLAEGLSPKRDGA